MGARSILLGALAFAVVAAAALVLPSWLMSLATIGVNGLPERAVPYQLIRSASKAL